MSKIITLKSIAFRLRHFKVNICCAHHQPVTQQRPVSAQTRSIDEYGLVEFSPILSQESGAVLAEFAALVSDCARVDPNQPTNVLLDSNLVIQTARGALLRTGWLESQQQHELSAAERCRAEKLPYGGSCVVLKSHLCIERR